ncbi:RiPP maturation radical SAM C-methyltransferase [Nonomuraea antimicrobica]
MTMRPLSPSDMVMPDYDAYFDQWAPSRVANWAAPVLVVEAARGCWWGEKHHCTFCGLNGSFMQFRSKSPATFFDEIVTLARRHQILDVCVVDNILDMSYLSSLVPSLIESGYDLRFHYEIKSNLRLDQLRLLAQAGIVTVQPGIESLSSHVLRLMDKGVSGCQNVRLLRDASTAGVVTSWNYLYGFPGETSQDYETVLAQIPALHHLMPPETVNRIAIERFSPYFDRPELGFADLKPTAQNSLIYGLPEEELLDISYIFDAAPRGIDENAADRLREVLDGWRDEARKSRLTQCDLGHRIVLVSRRAHFDWTVLVIDDPVECAAFRLLEQPRRVQSLVSKLSAQCGRDISLPDLEGLLRRWRALGLIFEDDGQIIHVVPEAVNGELLRVGAAVDAHETGRPEPSMPRA